ncbi:hypothetical protein BDN70DRAFT_570656 [Pholiota conissans]|uniref:Uncharacterized protein n=1 Tax=Pholiota conissans TaxID=109636 RepID=A0A9P5YLF7_9AGAR|nr:hypothetical protein BDN70DRAFT_570656 [Pholiota conissans]
MRGERERGTDRVRGKSDEIRYSEHLRFISQISRWTFTPSPSHDLICCEPLLTPSTNIVSYLWSLIVVRLSTSRKWKRKHWSVIRTATPLHLSNLTQRDATRLDSAHRAFTRTNSDICTPIDDVSMGNATHG